MVQVGELKALAAVSYVRRLVPAHDVHIHVQSSTSLQHVLCDSINCSQAPLGHPGVSTGCRKSAGRSIGHTRTRTYETDAASQHEEPVEVAHPDDILNLFLRCAQVKDTQITGVKLHDATQALSLQSTHATAAGYSREPSMVTT